MLDLGVSEIGVSTVGVLDLQTIARFPIQDFEYSEGGFGREARFNQNTFITGIQGASCQGRSSDFVDHGEFYR